MPASRLFAYRLVVAGRPGHGRGRLRCRRPGPPRPEGPRRRRLPRKPGVEPVEHFFQVRVLVEEPVDVAGVLKALELTLQHFTPSGFNFILSYVLSSNRGNYDGFAETYDVAGSADIFPNNTNQFGIPERMINSEGLLPNDRTHVLKFSGSYVFDFGLTAGMIFQWMSGTPLNELGVDATYGASTFLVPRGTAGRTPSIWDLNFRFQYDFSGLIQIGKSTKLILDVLHFASQKKEIDYDQYHYYDYDQQYTNPNYMMPVQFQPPMSFRLGLEVNI